MTFLPDSTWAYPKLLLSDEAGEGYYDTVAAREYVHGRLHTFQSMQEYQPELMQRIAQGHFFKKPLHHLLPDDQTIDLY